MKMGTGTKITIGIIVVIAAGTVGFLISNYQLNASKAGKGQIAATAEQGGANAPGKTSGASADQHSKEQGVMDKDAKVRGSTLMETPGEAAASPDTGWLLNGNATFVTQKILQKKKKPNSGKR